MPTAHLAAPPTRMPAPTASTRAPGVLAAVGVAALANALAALAARRGTSVSPMFVALGLGLLLAQTGRLGPRCARGLEFACRPLLRVAIALLGARVGWSGIAELGVGGILGIAAIVTATLFGTRWLARRAGLSDELGWLLAAGHAICGAAAIAATDAIVRAKSKDVATALALVTLFGTVAMLTLPLLGRALQLGPQIYGMLAGGAVHEVAQAVAAGFALGDEAGTAATLVKLTRVACLVPVTLGLAVWQARRRGARGPIAVPWFVVGFAGLAAGQALGAVPTWLSTAARETSALLMTVAMAALGLTTSLRELRGIGARPLVVATLATLLVTAAAGAVSVSTR
jgi:uncharacterized integral membrane protein (TIGR00698 family)